MRPHPLVALLDPHSPAARDIASLFWWMTGAAFIGLGVVVALLLAAWLRRRRAGIGSDTEGPKPGERTGWLVVIGAGIALPVALVSALFVIADILVIRTTQAPAAGSTRLTVVVTGHQWWWEVRYPGTAAVTANEIHIPAGVPVRVEVRTADVIHSLWVPQLNRKIDTIPHRSNAILLQADTPGIYAGRCAEFCGLQHAHMGLLVIAQPEADFRAWLARESRPAPASAPAAAAGAPEPGLAAFLAAGCGACHTVRGTPAHGFTGPDLTHVAARRTLAAATILNTPADLRAWIADPQHRKPGNQMPDLGLAPPAVDAIAGWLEGLR